MKISAFVITYNEEHNIEACLKALAFCDGIIVDAKVVTSLIIYIFLLWNGKRAYV